MPPPAGVARSINLNTALCSNDISINQHSGYTYITNEESDTVSLIKNEQLVGSIFIGNWPIHVNSDPNSNTTYATSVFDGISVINGNTITKHIPPYHESYYITINTVNNTTYINDLWRPITILQESHKVKDLFAPDFDGHQIVWQLAADYDRQTGKTFFASWQYGVMTVVDGVDIDEQFLYYGEGAKDMVIDSDRRFIYVSNFRAGEDDGIADNISIINIDTKAVKRVHTGQQSRHIDLDPVTGFAYATNPKDNTITIMKNGHVWATVPVGKNPWDVTVDRDTGYAYVGNSGDNTISVFKEGAFIKIIPLPADKGYKPWRIAIHPHTHDVYVLDRSSYIKNKGLNRREEVCEQPWLHILR